MEAQNKIDGSAEEERQARVKTDRAKTESEQAQKVIDDAHERKLDHEQLTRDVQNTPLPSMEELDPDGTGWNSEQIAVWEPSETPDDSGMATGTNLGSSRDVHELGPY